MSDAIDDPDNNGFWTTLALFNRWRHTTSIRSDNREAELQYLDPLDELPAGAQLANGPVRVIAFGNIGLCG